jgi:hypothetical protein
VSGWALATDTITKLELSWGPKVIATAFYGVPRPDVERLYPACPGAGHCGFIARADLPTAASGTVALMLTVHTVDGRVGTSPLRIDIPPQRLATGTTKPVIGFADLRSSARRHAGQRALSPREEPRRVETAGLVLA